MHVPTMQFQLYMHVQPAYDQYTSKVLEGQFPGASIASA